MCDKTLLKYLMFQTGGLKPVSVTTNGQTLTKAGVRFKYITLNSAIITSVNVQHLKAEGKFTNNFQ